jgi:hypothetical protein
MSTLSLGEILQILSIVLFELPIEDVLMNIFPVFELFLVRMEYNVV